MTISKENDTRSPGIWPLVILLRKGEFLSMS
jgi:hypothetical protein